MKNMRKTLSVLLALAMLLGLMPTTGVATVTGGRSVVNGKMESSAVVSQPGEGLAYAQAVRENQPQRAGGEMTVTKIEKPQGLTLGQAGQAVEQVASGAQRYQDEDVVRVFVVLDGEEALLDQGFTTEQIAGNASAVKLASNKIQMEQSALVQDMNAAAAGAAGTLAQSSSAPLVTVRYNFSVAVNAISVEMPYGMLKDVQAMAGVKSAFVAPRYDLPETVASDSAQPFMYATQETFGSAQTWQELGYTGAGTRIAVIDTGLDLDHPSFTADPALTEDSMTVEDLTDSVLSMLKASQMKRNLTAQDLYRSAKVPYGFNYVDENLEVTHDKDTAGDHGTHVAGIAAANKLDSTDVVGVAPDAQILVMKVFGANGGAYFDDIVAALEDCFVLDVDAVNLSLGSPAGFNLSDSDDAQAAALSDAVYGMISSHDMVVSIAAGNSGSAAANNELGTDLDFTSNPDNSTMSSPATYPGATVVASVDNVSEMSPYFLLGSNKIAYTDTNESYGNPSFASAFGGETLEYVMVPGLGTADDFAQVDVTDKVAVVSRGTIAFTEKQQNATDAGAIACIVYDNVTGALSNMMGQQGTVPSIFVTKESGALLAAGSGSLSVPEGGDLVILPYATAGQVSSFSSWGVSPNLELTPDVAAPGGQIYSSVDGGKYDTYGGTSMTAPHIAGMSALVLQYLKAEHSEEAQASGDADAWYHSVAQALIMSTATPTLDEYGVLASPRHQGAGVANVYDAVTSPAYLTVADNGSDDEGTPKASLGDDPEKTGEYTFTFTINNFSDQPQFYTLGGNLQTEYAYAMGDVKFMTESGYELSGSVEFDQVCSVSDIQFLLDLVNYEEAGYYLSEEALEELAGLAQPLDVFDTADVQVLYTEAAILAVPAGGSVDVEATVSLSESDVAYIEANFPNGIYVEGFVRCYAVDGETPDLCLPYMAYYGDWGSAPVFDTGWYYQGDEMVRSRYPNVLWTNVNGVDVSSALGLSPYFNETYDPSHNVLSPNGDGTYDYISEIYLGMMRNADKIEFIWTRESEEGSEELFTTTAEKVRKSYYYSSYGLNLPFLYSNYLDEYFTSDAMTQVGVENGDVLKLTIKGYSVKSLNFDEEREEPVDVIEVPVYIDTEAPTAQITKVAGEEGSASRSLEIALHDNYDIAALYTLTQAGDIIDGRQVAGTKTDSGEDASFVLDVSDYDTVFQVVVCDWGGNESYYQVSFPGAATLNTDKFYAYRQFATVYFTQNGGNYVYGLSNYNGWHSFTTPDDLLMHSSAMESGESYVTAADYVDGYILAVDEDNVLFTMKAGTWVRNVLSATALADYPLILDMAFDRVGMKLYLLTDKDSQGVGHLLQVNVLTGAVTGDSTISGLQAGEGRQLIALACDNAGQLYAVDFQSADGEQDGGYLYTLSAAGSATLVGQTGHVPAAYGDEGYLQSMTVDHGSDKIYWATYDGYLANAFLLELDKTSGAVTESQTIALSSELVGLFKPSANVGVFDDVDKTLTGVTLTAESVTLVKDGQEVLTVLAQPYYADLGEITWESEDPDVAVVDEDGVVTGVAAGETVVTATIGEGDHEVSCTVYVCEPSAELYFYDAGNNYAWIRVGAENPADGETLYDAAQPSGMYDVFLAAAWADGDVYAWDSSGNFYKLDSGTLENASLLGSNDGLSYSTNTGVPIAMAFNPADGYLYLLAVRVVGSYWFATYTYSLDRVNPANGETETVFELDSYDILGSGYMGEVSSLAIDGEGTFYTLLTGYDQDYDDVNVLISFDLNEDDEAENVSACAMPGCQAYMRYTASSLTWSYDDGCLYAVDMYGDLYWVARNGDFVNLGSTNGMGLGLHEVPSGDNAPVVSYAEVENVKVNSPVLVPMGTSINAAPSVEPWNARLTDATYTSSDENIAVVDNNGVVTGMDEGEATITISYGSNTAEISVTVVNANAYIFGGLSNYGYLLGIPATTPDDLYSDLLYMAKLDVDGDFALLAGAWYNNTIYGYGQYSADYASYNEYFVTVDMEGYVEVGAPIDQNIRDMAFDYTTGVMYATVDNITSSSLAQLDLTTGKLYTVCTLAEPIASIAVDKDGQLWAVGMDAMLYTVDKATGACTPISQEPLVEGELDISCSMTYDYDSDNLYWAYSKAGGAMGALYLVDRTSGMTAYLGALAGGVDQVVSLFTIPTDEVEIPESTPATGVVITEKEAVVVGETVTLTAQVLPVSVAQVGGGVSWTSSDPTVATVADGVVTGVAQGTATITAAVGSVSASCTVTVLTQERKFYAYDESQLQWISFPMDDPADVTVEKTETDVSPIVASLYVNDTLYAYDMDGNFYIVDDETFDRGEAKTGAVGCIVEVDNWGEMVEMTVRPVDMSYDTVTDKAYVLLNSYDEDLWLGATAVCEVDLTDGTVGAPLFVGDGSALFTNLYVHDSAAWMVDGFVSGVLNYVDLTADAPEALEVALVPGYGGEWTSGRSLVEDTLTGRLFYIRDLCDSSWVFDEDWNVIGMEYDPPHTPTLYQFSIPSANISPVGTDGVIYGRVVDYETEAGEPGAIISSLFIK